MRRLVERNFSSIPGDQVTEHQKYLRLVSLRVLIGQIETRLFGGVLAVVSGFLPKLSHPSNVRYHFFKCLMQACIETTPDVEYINGRTEIDIQDISGLHSESGIEPPLS